MAEAEPNDVHPFQDLGTLAAGRYIISGTGETAGHDPDEPMFFVGDLDAFSFSVAADGEADFEAAWDGAGEDFDMLLFEGLTATSVFAWDAAEGINQSSTGDEPERMSEDLVAGTVYTVLLSNWEGTDGAAYTITIDIP